ncbi:MAG: hypothetical protein OXC05_05085 [Halieaceae bacterium]|nr:hypothetical protein [Halieaceae bacterium]
MSERNGAVLPEQFSELNPFVARWNNRGMQNQYAARVSSTMDEMQEFYDAIKPHIPEIKQYLDSKDFAEYSEADRTLGSLVFAWVPVAESVEVFKQPKVPDSKMYWDIVDEPQCF